MPGGDFMGNARKIAVLCTSRIYDPQVHEYIEKLNETLKTKEFSLLVFTINSDIYWKEDTPTGESAVYDIIPYDIADAVIIMDEKIKSKTIARKILEKAAEENTPVVIVDGSYEGVSSINYDYTAGFEQVVRHVFEKKNVKNPHLVAGIPDNPFSDARIEVFKKVIKEYGFEFEESMLSYGYFWAVPAREAAEKLIAEGNIPDAIICANDIMAINVSDVFIRAGYKIPEDILLSGFDGYDEVFLSSPRITTVNCTTPGLADATAEMVLKITETGLNAEEHVVVEPVLVPNESTGCSSDSGYDKFMLARFNNTFYRHQDDVRAMYDVITDMQMSRSILDMLSKIRHFILHGEEILKDASFVIDRHCFSLKHYYFDRVKQGGYTPDYSIACASTAERFIPLKIDKSPFNMKNRRFTDRLESGYPLIFNSLDYMNVPLGYICYFFSDYDITNYSRTVNITNTIGMGIGGYINMSYQRRLANKLDKMYKKDPLTGLYNRVGFYNALVALRKEKGHLKMPATVIMSDLDGLKVINDSYSHAEGDNAILTLACALRNACPDGSLCVRFGGDELFALVVGDYDAENIVKDIEKRLDEYNSTSGKEYSVIASCGFCSTVFDENFNFKKALHIADEKMYEVKKKHKEEE